MKEKRKPSNMASVKYKGGISLPLYKKRKKGVSPSFTY